MTLPEGFVASARELLGMEAWPALERGLAMEPVTSVRLNPFKLASARIRPEVLDGRVPWCRDGYYLRRRPDFTFDPSLHAGAYYVQEASSMFLGHALGQHVGGKAVTMLDMCAAPGGKSMAARAVLPEGSLLVANEAMAPRARVLVENMSKFGHPDVVVTNNLPGDFTRSGLTFDAVLADAPCSGEGMFRKDPGAVGEWSERNVERSARLQREILSHAWRCLKPGGLLIYSTCTINARENEENALFIRDGLGGEMLEVDVSPEWGIMGSLLPRYDGPAYRFLPGIARGEGLFMVLARKGPGPGTAVPGPRPRGAPRDLGADTRWRGWLAHPERFTMATRGNLVMAVPKAWRPAYDAMEKTLNVLSAGIVVAEAGKREAFPAQPLALSLELDRGAFPEAALSYAQAIAFLRKEAIELGPGAPRGCTLMTYGGLALGFGKNIGNRVNNPYPAQWRIRSAREPGETCEILENQAKDAI